MLLLAALSLFLFIWKIGSTPILDGDTAYGAAIAKNIINSGDWMTLRFMNPLDLVPKPPLFYWIMAVGMKIFGINEFGLSIFHSLIGVFTVLTTYLIAKELYNEKIALWSGLILLTTAQFFYAGRSPLQDMPLTFFVAAAFYCFILYEKKTIPHPLYPIAYFLIPIFTALALLIKGPVALPLVLIPLFVYTIWNKSFFKHFNLRLILLLLLFLAIAAPWFIAEYKILGKPFADIMIKTNLGRFFHPTDSIGNDPTVNTARPQYDFYSYFLQLFILFVPWAGFLYPAIFSQIKNKESRFVISWALGIIIFFSLSLNYKISRYILPAYPALAIIIAKFLSDALEKAEEYKKPIAIAKWLTAGLIIPLLVIGTIYMIISFPSQQAAYQPIVLPFIIIFTLGMIISSIFMFRNQLKTAIILSVILSVVSYSVLIPCIDTYFPSANPIKEFCQIINKKSDGIPVLYKADSSAHFAGFYLNQDFIQTRDKETVVKALKNHGTYIISEDQEAQKEFKNSRIISQKSNFVLFSN